MKNCILGIGAACFKHSDEMKNFEPPIGVLKMSVIMWLKFCFIGGKIPAKFWTINAAALQFSHSYHCYFPIKFPPQKLLSFFHVNVSFHVQKSLLSWHLIASTFSSCHLKQFKIKSPRQTLICTSSIYSWVWPEGSSLMRKWSSGYRRRLNSKGREF